MKPSIAAAEGNALGNFRVAVGAVPDDAAERPGGGEASDVSLVEEKREVMGCWSRRFHRTRIFQRT